MLRLLSFLFFFLPFSLLAQTVLEGTVYDSTNQEKLPQATVIVKNLSGKTLAFTISNETGAYRLEVGETDSAQVQVRFLGFEPKVRRVLLDGTTMRLNFSLVPSTTALQEVEIKGDLPPVIYKEDTTRYDVEQFRDSTEVTLGDLLGQLPGVEVDESGAVKVDGKKVDKLLIEGREFFGDNQRLATENLSAKMIGEVEVYRNYQEIGMLRDFGESDQTAVNIGIKEEYKGRPTGNVQAGYGYKNRYTAGTNLFQFTDKMQNALLLKANNTGEQVLTFEDYNRMVRSAKLPSADGSIRMDGSTSQLVNATDEVAERRAAFGAVNLSWYPSQVWKIRGYGVLSQNSEDENRQSTTRFLAQDSLPDTRQIEGATNRLRFANAYFRISHNPKEEQFWDYALALNPNSLNRSEGIQNFTGQEQTQQFARTDEDQNILLSQQLKNVQRLGQRSLLYTQFGHQYERTQSKLSLKADSSFLGLSLQEPFRVAQQKKLRAHRFKATSELKYRIPNHLLLVDWAGVYENITYDFKLDTLFIQNIKFNRTKTHLQAKLQREVGSFRYTLGLRAQYVQLYDRSKPSLSYRRVQLLPELRLRWQPGMSRLQFRYRASTRFVRAQDRLTVSEIRNFQNIRSGALPLDFLSVKHNAFLSYFIHNALSGTILNLGIFYRFSDGVATTETEAFPDFTQTFRRTAPRSWRQGASLYWVQVLGLSPFSLRVQGSYGRGEQPSFLGQQLVQIQSESLSGALRLKSAFERAPFDFSVGLRLNVQQTNIPEASFQNRLQNWNPFVRFRGKVATSWVWKAGLTYRQFRGQRFRREIWDARASLHFRPKAKPYSFALRGRNLLNLSSPEQVRIATSPAQIQETVLQALPGFVVLELRWML